MAEANDAVFISGASPANTYLVKGSTIADVAFVFFASWLFSIRTARRVANWSLPVCWLLHIGTGLVGVVLIPLIYFAVAESPIASIRAMDEALDKWAQHPWMISLILSGSLVYTEVITLGIAFAVSAWGAVADERLRDSYRHSLRQTWIRTPHAVLIVLCVSLFAGLLEKAGHEWRLQNPFPPSAMWPSYPVPPTIPASDPNYAAAQKQYQQEMREFRVKVSAATRASRDWHTLQPWYLRFQEPVTIGVGIAGALWWLAGLLAAVAISRRAERSELSPLCLRCGYGLNHLSMESRCPECGQPVIDSLGPRAQSGAAWERRSAVGGWRAWWQTWRAWGRNVTAFGRGLKWRSQHSDYRSFALLHLPVVFLIGAAGMVSPVVANPGPANPFENWTIVVLIGCVFGAVCAIGTTLLICGTASLVGWYLSLRSGRNLLPAAMQISAYGVVYLLAWEVFGAFLINCAIHLQMNGMYNLARELTGIPLDLLFILSCHIPNLICGLVFLWLVAKGTNAARYANQ